MPNTTTVSDVYAYLVAQGIAPSSTWDMFTRRLVDQPAKDQLIVIQEDGGFSPEQPASSGLGDSALAWPGVMVTVRAGAWDADSSFAKAEAIRALLHGKRDLQLSTGGTRYFGISAMTPEPVFAGFDDIGRPMHTISFRLLKLA